MAKKANKAGTVRTGIGGWVYPAWRETFYPPSVKPAEQLAYASSKLATIEINGTFYRTQTPASFAKWRDETPGGFVFSVKAARGAAQRKDPAEAAPSITRFLESGLTELGDKLGPILWQLPPTRVFDAGVVAQYLDLLPETLGGLRLRHVIEAQHASFASPEALALLTERGIARAMVETSKSDLVEAITAGFVYLRLERTEDAEPAGYAPADLDRWASRLTAFSADGRDVFAYVISGAKHRAPAAAMALAERLA